MTQAIKDSRLIAFSILGYIFSFFGWQLPLILVVAYALAIAKDNLLSKQALQALYLYIAYTVVLTVIGWGFTALNWIAGSVFRSYGFLSFLAGAQSVISILVGVLLLVLVLLAIFKLMKQDAPDLPILGRLAELTLGIAKPKQPKAYAAAAQSSPAQSSQAQPTQAPPSSPTSQTPPAAPPAPPAPPAPAAPPAQEPVKTETASQTWTCSCGRENKGNFCVSCGKPKS